MADSDDADDDNDMPAPFGDLLHRGCDEVVNLLESKKDVPDEKPTEEEKKSLWKRFMEWLKQLPANIMSKFSGIELDLDGKLTVGDLINIKRIHNWYDHSGDGMVINCPTELLPGDHIAVKMKSSRKWWNHMIVTDVYQDGFDVVSPCRPSHDPNDIKLESDFFSLKDIGIYFGMCASRNDMEISEFPVSWSSVKKVVCFTHDVNGKFTREQIVEQARLQIGKPDMWDLNSKNSEQFVIEVLTGNCSTASSEQKQLWEKGIAAAGEGINTTFSLGTKIHLAFKMILNIVKFIVRLALSEAVDIISVISKTIKILGIIGFCIGPIMSVISCVWSLYLKHKRFKNGEIEANEFRKFVTQKVAELLTDILFSLISVICFFLVPIPIVNTIVSVFLSIIGFLISKAVGWTTGYIWDKVTT